MIQPGATLDLWSNNGSSSFKGEENIQKFHPIFPAFWHGPKKSWRSCRLLSVFREAVPRQNLPDSISPRKVPVLKSRRPFATAPLSDAYLYRNNGVISDLFFHSFKTHYKIFGTPDFWYRFGEGDILKYFLEGQIFFRTSHSYKEIIDKLTYKTFAILLSLEENRAIFAQKFSFVLLYYCSIWFLQAQQGCHLL